MPIKISGATSGSATLIPVASGADVDLTLPDHDGRIQTEVDLAAQKVTDDADLAAALALRPQKNLIINGDFALWQRGTSDTGNGYIAVDRWRSNSSTVNFFRSTFQQSYSLKMTTTASTTMSAITTIELPASGLAGQFSTGTKMVLSFWAKSDAHSFNLSVSGTFSDDSDYSNVAVIFSDSNQLLPANVWTKFEYHFEVGVTPNGSNRCVRLNINSGTQELGAILRLAEAQLEIGEEATEFEYVSVPEQLARCQRYFWVGVAPGSGWGHVYSTAGTDRGLNHTSFPVTMRVSPTMGRSGGTPSNCTHDSLGAYKDGFYHRVDVTSTGIFRYPGVLYTADAEL